MTTSPLSVRSAFADKEVLLTGTSGFVGKVLLLLLLERVDTIGRIHLLIRPNKDRDALDRFEHIVNTSHAFERLHRIHGPNLGPWLRERVVVHAGDITQSNFGLDPQVFGGQLDLIINCAASVDFRPDVRDAARTNIVGALQGASLAHATGARLVHVSTCYTAGERQGWVPEEVGKDLPSGKRLFDPEAEYTVLKQAMDDQQAWHDSPLFAEELQKAALDRLTNGAEPDPARVARQAERLRSKREEDNWIELGSELSNERGWPNAYTYTKAIAEGIIAQRYPTLPLSIVRPSIVESALSFPMAGWNEGFNTSGPLTYLFGTWAKAIPGRATNPFDVIPVDLLVSGITVAAAALLEDRAAQVYHCGTSDQNMLTLGRAAELTGLTHRRWARERTGDKFVDRFVKPRADTTLYNEEHVFSLQSTMDTFDLLARGLRNLPEKTPRKINDEAARMATKLERNRRDLRKIDKMINVFAPFTRDLRQRFQTQNFRNLKVVEPEFQWNPEQIDWRDYWMNVQMPGMRKWSFPLYENKKVPVNIPAHPVQLKALTEAAE